MIDAQGRLRAALADRYRIEGELGQGGMATVYLAQDLRHDRKVALKLLRPELAAILGGDRFLKEIKTTANLQHPHILPLFESGEVEGMVYYVMPYVEGESLRDRLAREKQLPIDEAVRIAREVADALDYAHRHGVVHRDIKPENILLHDGRALVADFGIALAVSTAGGGTRMTETGMSLGTPHYMSPEQAMGEREVTARSDVYALGCVVYEMLTGEPPFTGPTAQAIVARVVTEEPRPLTLQRKTIPPHVEAAVLAALHKLPADRPASAAQFAEALVAPGRTLAQTRAGGGGRAGVTRSTDWRPIALGAALVAVAAVSFAVWALTRGAPAGQVSRFALQLGTRAPLRYTGRGDEPPRLAISPDGRELVYVGYTGPNDQFGLYLRSMDRLEASLLSGTEGGLAPAISPDGSQVAFLVNTGPEVSTIRVASLRGGPPITVLQAGIASNVSWGPDGYLYFLDASGRAVSRVASSGGRAEEVVRLQDPDSTAFYEYLHVLPGGRTALVTAFPRDRGNAAGYALRGVDLSTGKLGASVEAVAGVYVRSGHLLYTTYGGTLMGVGYDPSRLILRGRPVALIEGLDVRIAGLTDLAVSETGTLAYSSQGLNAPEDFVWISRAGELTVVDPGWNDTEFENYELSPDGTRLAATIVGNRDDVWIKQLDRGPKSRITFGGAGNYNPAWTSDGRYVSYVSNRDGRDRLWRRRADGVGPEEEVLDLGRDLLETRWSRDGRWLLLSVLGGASLDLYVMQLGVDSAPKPLLAESHDEGLPAVSPDGRWLAYVSTETGEPQVFVRPFPLVQEGKWQLSTGGGDAPLWSHDGRELYFRAPPRDIQVVDLSRGPSAASPRTLIQLPGDAQFETNGLGGRMFQLSRDGRRFLMVRQGTGDKSGDLIVVQNFFRELTSATAASRTSR